LDKLFLKYVRNKNSPFIYFFLHIHIWRQYYYLEYEPVFFIHLKEGGFD